MTKKPTRESIETLVTLIIENDPYLSPYHSVLYRRLRNTHDKEYRLTRRLGNLKAFASGHEYFGLHKTGDGWIFREWAPNATALYLIGEFSSWRPEAAWALQKLDVHGIWEIRLPSDCLRHQDLFRLFVEWPGGQGDRIPAYARQVIQDPHTYIFNARVWDPPEPYGWHTDYPLPKPETLLIYEAHVGMAQDAMGIGTFDEFTQNIIPRIVDAGYNTIQLMAVQEHPYYASFGYHVSSFFAPSSRFGTPDDLKRLIDTAHGHDLRVVMDIVHSHAVNNEVEGLGRFDGTRYQYFHDGARGKHSAWDSRCFDYGKDQVLHFLLSNCRYWMEEYHFDGFRFDGITSMLYLDHGLEKAFTSYDDYFNDNVDEAAITYLMMANRLIHQISSQAMVIAEDISGLPGLAVSLDKGGVGFDYRLAMGIPDLWIKLIKERADEHWPLGHLWYELNNRRSDEQTISYAESHDQALVGDQTLIFRLIDKDMYDHMHVDDHHLKVDRGMALHKLIRLFTLSTAGNGYMNFMGNEFGHPEWIDFPREGNGWSYFYARRQWHLADRHDLKYGQLQAFDRGMIALAREYNLFGDKWPALLDEHSDYKIIAFSRGALLFVFNFHPDRSYTDYPIQAPVGSYRLVLCSDSPEFGGHGRIDPDQIYFTMDRPRGNATMRLYLPSRTAVVLEKR